MNSTSNDFASWVEEQLALPISSHREFYRKRTNPKYEFPYAVGATGPRPCELHSRWRRYALTSRDQLSNRKTSLSKHLMVELVNGKYVWKVDGHFRTVTTDPPAFTDSGYNMVLGVRYRILWDIGNTWKSDCVGKYFCISTLYHFLSTDYQNNNGSQSPSYFMIPSGCPIKIKYDGKTKILLNPEVSVESIEGDTSILPYNVVNLPHYKSTDFPSIEDSNDYPLFDTWIKPHENGLLNSTSLEISPTQCDDFPTFRQPFPYNEAGSPPGAFPAVFGRSTDVDTGLEVVFAYDPHLALYENTVENPVSCFVGASFICYVILVSYSTIFFSASPQITAPRRRRTARHGYPRHRGRDSSRVSERQALLLERRWLQAVVSSKRMRSGQEAKEGYCPRRKYLVRHQW